MDGNKDSQVGVRMDPTFRAEVKAAAQRHFGGNESLLLREAGRIYVTLRRKLGPQFEPTMALLIGDLHAVPTTDRAADALDRAYDDIAASVA